MTARRRHRVLAGLTITTIVATASIAGTNALAAPEPPVPLPPISEGLANLLAAGPFASEMVLVHGEDTEMADRAVTDSGMRKVTEFEKVGIVVAEASSSQMESARTKPGVTYLEVPGELEFFTDTSHDATRGKETISIYNGANGDDLDGKGISIAVIDSGIDPSHPSFADGKVVNNLTCDPDVGAAPGGDCRSAGDLVTDRFGHGTHVASVAAGRRVTLSDGTTVMGAAPGASIVSLAVGNGSNGIIGALTGLNWVLENHRAPCGADVSAKDCPPIRVTNNSYGIAGGSAFDPKGAEAKLQGALVDEGVASVWSAGNAGGDGSVLRTNGPGQDPTPGIISAAAFTDHETGVRDDPEKSNLADFSSRGLKSDPSTWPDISAPGVSILGACRFTFESCVDGTRDNGDFDLKDGTSFAAPHVAGAVAQLFQLKPFASPGDIEDALKDGAFKYDDDGNTYTRVESYRSSFDKGTGLIDVLRSADAVQPE